MDIQLKRKNVKNFNFVLHYKKKYGIINRRVKKMIKKRLRKLKILTHMNSKYSFIFDFYSPFNIYLQSTNFIIN